MSICGADSTFTVGCVDGAEPKQAVKLAFQNQVINKNAPAAPKVEGRSRIVLKNSHDMLVDKRAQGGSTPPQATIAAQM